MIRFVCADRDRAARFCEAVAAGGWPATRYRADEDGNMPYVVDVATDEVSAPLMTVARAHRMVRTAIPEPDPLAADRLVGAVRAAAGR